MPQRSFHSPIGDLTVSEDGAAIVALDWGWGRDQDDTALLQAAETQLNEYFDGARPDFDLPTKPAGTDFQIAVWRAMQAIPAGRTRTYGEVARELGSEARAVGQACGANPIPVIIPCHRILAAADLGGYSGDGGLETKRALLRLEGVPTQAQLF